MSMTLCVRGNVVVSDLITKSEKLGFNGMPLYSLGEYLIATDASSTAEIEVNGSVTKLLEGRMLHLRKGQMTLVRHHENDWTKDLKTKVGRLWLLVLGGESREEELYLREEAGIPNAVVGVRG